MSPKVINNLKYLVLVYNSEDQAKDSYKYLLSSGYTSKDITLVMLDRIRQNFFNDNSIDQNISHNTITDKNSSSKKATKPRNIIGGAIILIATTIASLGTLIAVYEIDLIIAGPIGLAIAGVGAGLGSTLGELGGIKADNTPGKLVEALVNNGLAHGIAEDYAKKVNAGAILLGLHVSPLEYDNIKNKINIKNINLT